MRMQIFAVALTCGAVSSVRAAGLEVGQGAKSRVVVFPEGTANRGVRKGQGLRGGVLGDQACLHRN